MDAAAWDERYAGRDLVWSHEPNAFVAAECADLAPGRALDLACGEGRNALWLAARGWAVTAADFSAVALDKGRALGEGRPGAERVAWVVADATAWAAEPAYDLVVLCYLQLPAAERGEAVRRAWGSVAPSGTFLLVAHDSANLEHGVGGPQDPAVLMTAEDVLGDLAGLLDGAEVVRAERVERVVAGADAGSHGRPGPRDRVALDCLVRLRRA